MANKGYIGIIAVGLLLAGCGTSSGEIDAATIGVTHQSLVDPDPGFSLLRYTATGQLDASFGVGGVVNPPTPNALDGTLVFDSANRLVVAGGSSPVLGERWFALARYQQSGAFDTSFGGGDGIVYTDFGETPTEIVQGLAVQSDGRIVAVGYGTFPTQPNDSRWFVARYLESGELDPSFGVNGKVITEFGTSAQARSVTIDSAGKLIVGGNTVNPDTFYAGKLAIVRYNTDGTLDTTFNGTGKVLTDVSTTGRERVDTVRLGPKGRIVVAGLGVVPQVPCCGSGVSYAVVARYNTNGTPDATFGGGNGWVALSPNTGSYGFSARDMFVDGSGRITVGGTTADSPARFELIRLTSTGNLDTTFSGDGLQVTGSPTGEHLASGLALAPGNKIVIGGNYVQYVNGSQKFGATIARYNLDGTLDTTFSGDGLVAQRAPNINLNINDSVVDSIGRIVLVGGAISPQ
ncbi:MAG: hypothetical protein ACOY0T_00010 [Myxococcota bacterium]